ncbi:cobalamin-binding protein [Methylocaldum sp.]|uniref:cobalamin-binding protein n=1 Tax=Methylocaldum sp. TaxID=1969727 RepID=UPI002D4DA909|nr:cobalamin-binding protein [Methylocaldum sp.]HYE34452.1 cobalamin-binding protein [Methylocaldum sp.]
MRVVSLLPAATEIVAALGLTDELVGVSHDCDFPPSVGEKPRVTACEIAGAEVPSDRVHDWVSDRLSRQEPLFTLEEKQLAALQPDLILTQSLCAVCAPPYDRVATLAVKLPGRPKVLNLEASTLEQILETIRQVADALSVPERGVQLVQILRERIARVRRTAEQSAHRPRVAVLEWLNPVFCSGHWTPELVDIAGGVEVLGQKGRPSVQKTWQDVRAAAPDLLIIACCGQSAARALRDWARLKQQPEVESIPAVQESRVYLVDGRAYFNRPGPRIVDSLEILAEILHPELFGGWFPDRGRVRPG